MGLECATTLSPYMKPVVVNVAMRTMYMSAQHNPSEYASAPITESGAIACTPPTHAYRHLWSGASPWE